MTTQFLREQYEQAKAELESITQRLTQFRLANTGRLPDQMNSNLQQVASLESRISALNANSARVSQEKLMLESDLRGLRERLDAVTSLAASGAAAAGLSREPQDEQLAALDGEIRRAERALELFLQQYKPEYPDVRKAQARLAALKREREAHLSQKPGNATASTAPGPGGAEAAPKPGPPRLVQAVELQAQIDRAEAAIRAKELEAERYLREIGESDRKLKVIHGRIESGPIGAGMLEQLMRDYDLAKARYEQLNKNVSLSEITTEVQTRRQGETLEVLDLPSLPESPTDPNRPLIILAGAALGLAVGFVMAAVRELKDQSLKTLKDVRAYTQFNVLGSVPLLENDLVVRRRRRVAWLAWSTACILSLFVMSGSVYYYLSSQV
jgi:uncharacterized protein involved in exopolysaccharide biosynthesis